MAEVQNEHLDKYKKEISDLDKQIQEFKEMNSASQNTFKGDIQKNQKEMDKIISEIQSNIASKDYEKASNLKEDLISKSDKQDKILGEKNPVYQKIYDLMEKKNEVTSKMKKANIQYYSESPGIVSTKIDGLEEKFSAQRISNYKLEDFDIVNKENKQQNENGQVKVGTPLFKIIDTYNWYIMSKTSIEHEKELKEGNVVLVKLNKDNIELKGKIEKVKKQGNEMIVIIKFKDYLHKLYNDRYMNLKLIKNKYEGLKVPKEAIVEEDGIKGVYIKDISGIVRFRAVNILYQNDKYAMIKEEDRKNIEVTINGKKELRRSLQSFDEVFINGSKVKEGQIIN
ncbi:hypothetical protein CLPU_5c00260 [Gottschalkia purinilytica]|uniref:Uncharacterized protein n=1 Tax=Gottschalkia purinilytica TaxID=1503 RepID=A0A0L0WB18_GOTPU|nr:hypothetical protein CLPU_5c00260 [Gottschalkia purinilytica]